jgi:hypothetical protein
VHPLTALLALALLITAIVALAWICLGGEGELMSGLFRAPGLGWPRGVQEEDPPPSWRRATPREALPGPEPMPVRPGPTHRAVRG